MKVKRLAALALVLSLSFGMCACGNQPAPQSQPEPGTSSSASSNASSSASSGEKIKIVLGTDSYVPETAKAYEKYVLEPMRAKFPDVEIEWQQYKDKSVLKSQIAGGGGPDIFSLDGPTDAVEYADSDRILDLTEYSKQFGWKDKFYEWAYNSCVYKDKLYSLPNSFEGMMMYYNDGIFEKEGWKHPTNVKELETLMDAAQAAGYIPIVFGNAGTPSSTDHWFSTSLSCYAGPEALKNALQGKAKWTDEPIRGAINQMVDWWQKGYITKKASQSISQSDQLAFFADGKAAMMMSGTWFMGDLTNAYKDVNWSVDIMPSLRDGVEATVPLAVGGCFAVNKNTEKPEKAVEILNWMFSDMDAHIASIEKGNLQAFPVKAFDAGSFSGTVDKRMIDMYGKLDQAQESNNVGYCAWTFFPTAVRSYMCENTDGIWLGTIEVDTYLNEVQKLSDKAVAEGKVPQLP
ncbi:extracellular solute-binding protein [Oscillospiraceae bacterium PP1C4]